MRKYSRAVAAIVLGTLLGCKPGQPAESELEIDLTAKPQIHKLASGSAKIRGYMYTSGKRLFVTSDVFELKQIVGLDEGTYFPNPSNTILIDPCPFRVLPRGFQCFVLIHGKLDTNVQTAEYSAVITQVQTVTLLDQELYPKPNPPADGTQSDPFKLD